MERRKFTKKMLVLSSAVAITGCSTSKSFPILSTGNIIKPKRLQPGDTIALIAPASAFEPSDYEKAVNNLTRLGFKVKTTKNLFKKWGFLAGTDQERVDDIHEAFSDKEVNGIWCLRGGYGTTRILHLLDYKLIQKNPKVLIGYSDITALLHAIFLKTGLIGFHGPVGNSTQNKYILDYFEKIIIKPQNNLDIEYINSGAEEMYKTKIITSGKASGQLCGGNLSLLSAITGTDHHWDAKGKLVFIEDIEEPPYRVDRMLTQLLRGSNLGQARGIILGVFKDCEKKEGDTNSLSLMEVLVDRLGSLKIPVYYGFSFGHINNICTIPIGIQASFDTANPKIKLLEAAVS